MQLFVFSPILCNYCVLSVDYDEKVLPSIVNEVAKQVVAQFTASELIFQREHVSKLIAENLVRYLRRKLAKRYSFLCAASTSRSIRDYVG